MLMGDRCNFGFIRSNIKDRGPIAASTSTFSILVSYPCLFYRAPNALSNKVFIQNFYSPEQVRILDLGKWKFLCSVENVLRTAEKGQVQVFSVMMKSPEGKICLVLFKVNPFETELSKVIQWEVAGVV